MAFRPSTFYCAPPEEPTPYKVGRIFFSERVEIMEYYTRDDGSRYLKDPTRETLRWRSHGVYKLVWD